MLSAIRLSDQKKVVGQLIPKARGEEYVCPGCGAEVIHHKSFAGVVIGHFKHKHAGGECSYAGESMEHARIKYAIYLYLLQNFQSSLPILEPEYRELDPGLRPDIFLRTKKGLEVAIEVQVSPISIEELNRRMLEYTRLRVHMLWVLPYYAERFSCTREELGWTHETGFYVRAQHEEAARFIRLTEPEVFLYWAAFKHLVFWPVSSWHTGGFTVVRMEESYSPGREMMVAGEHKKYLGGRNSMIKSILETRENVPFDTFRPSRIRAFRSAMRPYTIPGRLLLLPPRLMADVSPG